MKGVKEVPIKLRRPNNKYMKAYVRAMEKGYAKRRSATGKLAESALEYKAKN